MRLRNLLLASSTVLILAGTDVRAQDDDATMRAIPDPEADLPSAVTDEVPFPENANEQGAGHSAAGRSGERRDAGLDTARSAGPGPDGLGNPAEQAVNGLETAQTNAAAAAQEALAAAAEAAASNRENIGRAKMPEDLPDQVPEDVPGAPDNLPGGPPADLPGPPT